MQKGLIIHTVIANDKGEVLMLQRSKNNKAFPDYWDIPGGTLKDGEDPAQGAIRETKEETGLDISDPKLFFQKSNVDVAKNKQFVILVFHAKISDSDVQVNPKEHETYAWIQPSRVDKYKTVDYLADCLHAYAELLTMSNLNLQVRD